VAYPVEDHWWLANLLWGHRAIWNGPNLLWPEPEVWQGIAADLEAIFWPGDNWSMLNALLANFSTVRLIGGRVTTDPLLSARADEVSGDGVTRLRDVVGATVGTTVLVDASRYSQVPYAISHERAHALDAIFGLTDHPDTVAFFGERKPVEPWARAFARVVNGIVWSPAELDFVTRSLRSRGLI